MLRSGYSKGLIQSLSSNLRSFSTGAALKSKYGLFVNGEEKDAASKKTFAVINPANGETLTQVADGAEEDVRNAVENAKETFKSGVWSRLDVRQRARIMNNAASLLASRVPEVAQLESLCTGRAIREMNAQLGRLPEWLEYFSALIRTTEGSVPPFFGPYVNYVKRIPLGVVGQITPWNHPLLIAIKKIAPAIAAGNSVVVKPSELAPVTVIEFAKLLHEAGVPKGVVNVVPGLGPSAGKALAANPLINKLDITGGTSTGRAVASAAGANLVSVIAELGGKAPVIVFKDADIDQAVNGAAFASFVASGQTCIMGARILLHKPIYEEFVSKFVAKVSNIKLGLPNDPTTQMGPVISSAQRDRVERFISVAKSEGARVLCGGERPSDPLLQKGFYYKPTVLAVEPQMTVAKEEVFGPVTVIYPFEDEQDAIRLANDSPYGLAAAVWSKDIKRAHRVADQLDVGIIWLNDHHRNDPSSPWGGMKDSGMGRENGLEALQQYTQSRSVVVNTSDQPFDWFVSQGNVRYS